MKSILSKFLYALTLLVVGTAQAAVWEVLEVRQIVADQPETLDVTVGGVTRTVSPSCALGEDYDYKFHFKGGKDDRLVVYFAGGGACWDSATCIASLDEDGDGKVKKGEESDFVYIGSIDKADNPAVMGGLFSLDHSDNPYADWSMLFIPYCTGDVHVGSSDTTYPYPPNLGGSRTIRHHGFDNVLYAMNWLKTNHHEVRPEKILVAGSSAGAYGASFSHPWVREFYPEADQVFLASDAGVGVLTGADEFSAAVFGKGSAWEVHETIHPDLQSALNDYDALGTPVIPAVYNLLRTEHPKDQFAQYTTAYDVVQILFWDIMLNPNPMEWGQGLSDPYFIGGWNVEMNAIIEDQQQIASPDNYRSYIAPGCNHTIFGFDDDFYGSSLISSTGEVISFLQWLSAMTGGKGADKQQWQNLTCSSDEGGCGGASLTSEAIYACLARSYPLYFPL
jgi:hypothetical protein